MQKVYAVILAAGRSKRFAGPTSKLLTPLCQQPVVLYSLKLVESLNLPKSFVLGHEAEKIQALISQEAKQPTNFDLQSEQLGTGHAVACSQKSWLGEQILVLNADMPLVPADLVTKLIQLQCTTNSALSFVAFRATSPGSYGRIVQSPSGIEIIEFKECSPEQQKINLVNAGIYIFSRTFLEKNLAKLSSGNTAHEFYLTDLVKIATEQKLTVNLLEAAEKFTLGINTREDFALVETILQKQLNSMWEEKISAHPTRNNAAS